MFNRFSSDINKKLAEQLASKVKPTIEKIAKDAKLIDRASIKKNLEPYDPIDIAMHIGGATGAAIGAASAYDEKASATKNIIKGTAFGILGGSIGYVAPPITGLAGIIAGTAIVENVKPLIVGSASIGLGLGTMKMFSKLTSKSPSENLENINVNDTSNKKSLR